GRVLREADNPLKEGDLLFNLTFQAHVAVVGLVNWTGLPGETPTDQVRQMQTFISILEREGVVVDAYMDLHEGKSEGKLIGEITNKTRFIIRGVEPITDQKEGRIAERVKAIKEGMDAARKEAAEKGMFLISANNLANVIGYRQPRSANDLEVSD